jgi:curved DNA-binding protein CbpA
LHCGVQRHQRREQSNLRKVAQASIRYWPSRDARDSRPTAHFDQISNLQQVDPSVSNAVRAILRKPGAQRSLMAESGNERSLRDGSTGGST